MSDAEREAEETRVWLEFAHKCGYISEKQFEELDDTYDKIVAQLVKMLSQPSKWRIRQIRRVDALPCPSVGACAPQPSAP